MLHVNVCILYVFAHTSNLKHEMKTENNSDGESHILAGGRLLTKLLHFAHYLPAIVK